MQNAALSPEEQARYARHLILPEFGEEGQLRLKSAKVLVVGAGGLGSPLLSYLAAAGVGTIGIVDYDRIELSNLQRQVLFATDDIGESKAETARARIEALNPHVHVRVHLQALRAENALEIIADYDLVADGTDNFPTRYLVNDACVLLGKPNVYAAIFRFDGQLSVFNALMPDGSRGPNYRDIFPEPPAPGTVLNCAEGGVLGVLPGIVGAMQASEVIKLIAGVGEPLIGKLFILDVLRMESRTLVIRKDPRTSIQALIDYEAFCGLPKAIQSISVAELMRWKMEGRAFQLIDVREPHEHAQSNLGGELIPVAEIAANTSKISRDQPVVIHCQSGKRSAAVIAQLQNQHGFENLWNLEGGILAWKALERVD